LSTAAGLALGFAADRIWGDPRRGHPVAGFGRVADSLERRTYADSRVVGTGHVMILVGAAGGLGLIMEALAGSRPVLRTTLTAVATWTVLGGRSLSREAGAVADQLAADDLAAARVQVRSLVGRETADLGSDEIARACVESVAENTSDAVVAPLLWGAVAGMPGLLGYRAINTLDAMIGHRTARYRRFGWAAARLDDLVNWIPARVSGLVAAGLALLVGGTCTPARRAMARDARQHPSPNAGVVEAAFAGALGVQLGGRSVYAGEAEDRGLLGNGRPVRLEDVARAVRLADAVGLASLIIAVLLRVLRR
jgi:adenosylcobinamide-phosphate synthase